MEEIIVWVTAEGRVPRDRSKDKGERSMARWLSDRRREAVEGTLHPAYPDGLGRVSGWPGDSRAAMEDARWHDRFAQLVGFRAEGNDWPRHHHYVSEREHSLGVWIHAQRQSTAAANSTGRRSISWMGLFPVGAPGEPGAGGPVVRLILVSPRLARERHACGSLIEALQSP
ncbi:helicase associated domain-containing protein [Paenarthrobacter nitroguajacolicus]